MCVKIVGQEPSPLIGGGRIPTSFPCWVGWVNKFFLLFEAQYDQRQVMLAFTINNIVFDFKRALNCAALANTAAAAAAAQCGFAPIAVCTSSGARLSPTAWPSFYRCVFSLDVLLTFRDYGKSTWLT